MESLLRASTGRACEHRHERYGRKRGENGSTVERSHSGRECIAFVSSAYLSPEHFQMLPAHSKIVRQCER